MKRFSCLLFVLFLLPLAMFLVACGEEKDKAVTVEVFVDDEKVSEIVTDKNSGYRIMLPDTPEDIRTNPEIEKYFDGWYLDSELSTPATFLTVFKSNSKIYGKFIDIDYSRFDYSVVDDVAIITKYNAVDENTRVVIPLQIGGTPVVEIDNEVFKENALIQKVFILGNIEKIGTRAFYNCENLIYIGVDEHNENYSSIDGVLYNKEETNCICCPRAKLESVTIPDTVTNIESVAFYNCAGLTSIVVNGPVTTIGMSTFYGCSGIDSFTFPQTVTTIGNYAFYDCVNLSTFTLPDNLISIGDFAFANCECPSSLSIPSTVTNIGESAFYGCFGLARFVLGGENENYSAQNGILYNKDKTVCICCPAGKIGTVALAEGTQTIKKNSFAYCLEITNVTLPNSVTTIGDHAFYTCANLTNITIPDNVTVIERYAFSYCRGLRRVSLPSGLTQIKTRAFNACSSLSNISLPASLTTIGDYAFNGCSALTSVTIPENVSNIDSYAFGGCTNLENFVVDENNTYYSSLNGSLLDKNQTVFICCPSAKTGSLTVPNGVTTILARAFSGCAWLDSVILPESVTTIEDEAFLSCSGLSVISIPKNVENIGGNVFAGCVLLENINVDEENEVFSSRGGTLYDKDQTVILCCPVGKTGTVTVAGPVVKIAQGAFAGCSGVTNIVLSDNVETIEKSAFSGCSSLEEIVMPNVVTVIPEEAFSGCTKLRSVTLSSDTRQIGKRSFEGCKGLSEMTITSEIDTIDAAAFNGCSNLKTVTIYSEKVYGDANSLSACGSLLRYVATVKVLADIINSETTENTFLNNAENFSRTLSDGFYVFTKNKTIMQNSKDLKNS